MTRQQPTGAAQQSRTPAAHLTLRFSGTPRGARLARRLAVQQVTEWSGLPHEADPVQAVALVTAELAANAIRHGSLPGRDFRLTLRLRPGGVRVEVTDTRPERLPPHPATPLLPADHASGRGLLLVRAYADRWGCTREDAWTKTVWAELSWRRRPLSAPSSRRPG